MQCSAKSTSENKVSIILEPKVKSHTFFFFFWKVQHGFTLIYPIQGRLLCQQLLLKSFIHVPLLVILQWFLGEIF